MVQWLNNLPCGPLENAIPMKNMPTKRRSQNFISIELDIFKANDTNKSHCFFVKINKDKDGQNI